MTMIDYLTSHLWLLWLIAAMVLLIIELGFGDFFVTCFAIGALCAMVVSFFPLPFWLQVVVFAACGAASVYLIRPQLLKRLHATGEERASNADALIGREGTLVEPITAGGSGYVKIDGDDWKAVTADGTPMDKGTRVRVVKMESIIVTVEKAK